MISIVANLIKRGDVKKGGRQDDRKVDGFPITMETQRNPELSIPRTQSERNLPFRRSSHLFISVSRFCVAASLLSRPTLDLAAVAILVHTRQASRLQYFGQWM